MYYRSPRAPLKFSDNQDDGPLDHPNSTPHSNARFFVNKVRYEIHVARRRRSRMKGRSRAERYHTSP